MKRWFTSDKGNELAIRPESFTVEERRVLDEILTFARDSTNRDQELLYGLDNAGTTIFGRHTGYKGVELPKVVIDAIGTDSVRIWHNHPSNGSISGTDWMVAGVTERTEVLAVTVTGTIYVGRIIRWSNKFDAIMGDNFPRLAGDLAHILQQHTDAHQVYTERVISDHLDGHLLNLCLSDCGVVRYAAQLSCEDEEALSSANSVGLIEVGRKWALKEIREALA